MHVPGKFLVGRCDTPAGSRPARAAARRPARAAACRPARAVARRPAPRAALDLVFISTVLILATPARPCGAASASPSPADARTRSLEVAEGRVTRLESRLSPEGYPVTDVTLEPGGQQFTILGGYRDGLLWRVEEEAQFVLGDLVRVRLERAPRGLRPAGGGEGVEFLERAAPEGPGGPVGMPRAAPAQLEGEAPDGTPARVASVAPSSGPAVAGDSVKVEVRGSGFGDAQGESGVFFQGFFEHVPAPVVAWSDSLIRCLVPAPGRRGSPQVLSGSVKVWTPGGGWSDGDQWIGGAQYHVLFQFAGDSWGEHRLPVEYWINAAGFPWPPATAREVVVGAAEAWHQAPFAYGRFAFQGFTDKHAGRGRDSTNVIGWTQPWPHNPGWIAVTWSGIDSTTGERQEVDVEINGEKPWSIENRSIADLYDLPTTLVHEFGHWIRLGHVQESEHVMLAYQNLGDVRRVLQEGDRQGAAWVYPTFGAARASPDTVYAGGPWPDTLVLDVQIADRRGRPVAGLLPGEVYAVASWLDGKGGPVSSLPASPPGSSKLLPEAPCDADGRTRIVVQGFSGRGRLGFTVVGTERSVRERPAVFVSGSSRVVLPAAMTLGAPRPNPAAAGEVRTHVRLREAVPRLVARAFDARGRLVRTLFDGSAAAGDLWLVWDLSATASGPNLGPGLYLLRVEAAGLSLSCKLVVLGR